METKFGRGCQIKLSAALLLHLLLHNLNYTDHTDHKLSGLFKPIAFRVCSQGFSQAKLALLVSYLDAVSKNLSSG